MAPIEERLRALEEEVARLKQQLSLATQNGKWWERISGSMREFPDFEEVLRLGRDYRRQQQLSDENSSDAKE